MSSLSDSWVQDVASDNRITAISPPVCRHLLPVIEMQIRKIIQQAHKFQKRGKSRCMTVEDINLALSLNGLEEIYGLCPPQTLGSSSSGTPASTSHVINLLTFARQPIPKCPLQPELSLHWLAVDGYQPLIPENPSAATVANTSISGIGDLSDHPLSLSQEIQHFYYRTTGLILACDYATLPTVLESLRTDMGLQDLVPYFSKFIYQQIRASIRSLMLLRALIDTVYALIENKTLRIEFHLQQLLPAIFTCIVASKLSTVSEDHWRLRSSASQVISLICRKYSELFPDFQARFCKTYVDALTLSMTSSFKGKEKEKEKEKDKEKDREKEREKDNEKRTSCLATMYGGLVGLQALGHTVVRSLLLPRARELLERIDYLNDCRTSTNTNGNVIGNGNITTPAYKKFHNKDREIAAEKCRCALLHALGMYMVSRLNMATVLSMGGNDSFKRKERADPSSILTKKKRRTDDTTGLVEGLEEGLVPYYASASRDLYYCRLFI